jgi:hypothetical protein
MKQVRTLSAVLVTMLVFASVLVRAQAKDDPLVGTWKLRVVSKDGKPASSNTLVFEPFPGGEKHRSFGVNAQGEKTGSSYTAYYDDGKDHPIVGNPNVDAVQLRRIDSHTTERINKKNGKVLTTARRVVSQDGKTVTITTTGTDARGEPVNTRTVYDKQ